MMCSKGADQFSQTLRTKVKGEAPQAPMTTTELLRSPGVAVVLYLLAHINLIALMYTAGMSHCGAWYIAVLISCSLSGL